MQPESVISVIESVADPNLAEDWDQSGVQAAATRRDIRRLAVALDPTPRCITQAIEWHADFILTHHPLSLKPVLPSRLDNYHTALYLLMSHEVWLYAAHTSLDVQTLGPVSWLASSLELSDLIPITELKGDGATRAPHGRAGYGVQGRTPVPWSWSELERELFRSTGLRGWRQTGAPPGEIRNIAFCPGSGMDLAQTAFQNGADVFISGDLKYHTAQAIEGLGLTIDVGHFILEEIMMQTWADHLHSALGQQDVDVTFFPGHDPIACATNE